MIAIEINWQEYECGHCGEQLAGLPSDQFAFFMAEVPEDEREGAIVHVPLPHPDGTQVELVIVELKSSGFTCPRCRRAHAFRRDQGTAEFN